MRETIHVRTRGRGTYDITAAIAASVRKAEIDEGLCHLFLKHTSASLIICENADPTVRSDLERFMSRLVQDGDPSFQHDAEGPDDMPAHIRSVLTGVTLTIPVVRAQLALGTWQGIYLWEHRTSAHDREVLVTVSAA